LSIQPSLYVPPRRPRAKPRVRPKPVAYNLHEESIKLVLKEIRKNKPTFTYNEAVALFWDTPWLREQTYAALHEQRKAQIEADKQGAAALVEGSAGGGT
jgi:hypothetical protein